MNETIIIAKWLAVFIATGLFGSILFVSENSKMLRYTVGKALGIILLAAITWILSLFHILPFSSLATWLVFIIAFGATAYLRRKYLIKFFKENYKQILIVEVIILGLFMLFLGARAMSPRIEGVEKFMDMAILSGLMRQSKGVPLDTWYAPSSINYYYFGHWIVASWAKLGFVSANYAFNLGYAGVLSIVGGMIYAVVHKLSGKIWAGLLGVFLALFSSNIYSFLSYLKHTDIQFFSSGRFVEHVINEYPLYSVVLGDLHAHMLGLILSVALFGILVIVADEKNEKSARNSYIVIGGLLGLMTLTNSFDVVNCGVLLAVYFCWELFIRKTNLQLLMNRCLAIFIPFAILLLISMLTFSPAVSGIQISLFKTPFLHIYWQFGAFFALIIAGIVVILLQPKPKKYIKLLISSYKSLFIIFAVSAIMLIIITEIIYFKDIYHYANPPFARANTQFKMWYSAWIMLAISAAAIYGEAFRYVKNNVYKIALIFIGFFVIGVTVFGTVIGYVYLRDSNAGAKHTINGTNFLRPSEPDKLAMVDYVNAYVKGQPIILQNGGESYSRQSWLSSYTGTASYIGWKSHEWGWRYSANAYGQVDSKSKQVRQVYESGSVNEFKNNLGKIGAKYVLVGPDETSTFNVNKQVIKDALGQPIYTSGQYELYLVQNN